MKIDNIDQAYLKSELLRVISKHILLSQYKVFFFGSRVKGDNFPRSDIDLGILGPEKIPSDIKFALEDELTDLPTLYTIDLVDFGSTSAKFKKEALKHTEPLN